MSFVSRPSCRCCPAGAAGVRASGCAGSCCDDAKGEAGKACTPAAAGTALPPPACPAGPNCDAAGSPVPSSGAKLTCRAGPALQPAVALGRRLPGLLPLCFAWRSPMPAIAAAADPKLLATLCQRVEKARCACFRRRWRSRVRCRLTTCRVPAEKRIVLLRAALLARPALRGPPPPPPPRPPPPPPPPPPAPRWPSQGASGCPTLAVKRFYPRKQHTPRIRRWSTRR